MLDKNKFLKRGTSLFGTAAVVLGSSAPSLVSNSYTLDDYKIYRLAKFFGIGFLINFVKKYVEKWCISANCKKIREFFKGLKEEIRSMPVKNREGEFLNCKIKTFNFDFVENMGIKFDLYESLENPSNFDLHKTLKGGDDESIFSTSWKSYERSTVALRSLENTRFLKEVYDGLVAIGWKPEQSNFKFKFSCNDFEVCIDLGLGGISVPFLEVTNFLDGKKFRLSTRENEEGAFSIDEMRKVIEEVKDFYSKDKQEQGAELQGNLENGAVG